MIIDSVLDIGGKLIDRLWPNPEDAAKAKLELAKMEQTGELAKLTAETDLAKGQQEINLEEAKSSNLFVSGWRPLVGWVCALAFAYHYIIQPFLVFAMAAFGYTFALPAFSMDALITVLFGLLGLGGLRSFEKIKGVAK